LCYGLWYVSSDEEGADVHCDTARPPDHSGNFIVRPRNARFDTAQLYVADRQEELVRNMANSVLSFVQQGANPSSTAALIGS